MSIPAATLSPEDIAGILARRHGALLQKYIEGKTSPKEEAEIAHIIAQLPRTEAAQAQPTDTPGQSFELEAQDAAAGQKRRSGYFHELTAYAERYDANLRTVKRWIADGRNATPPDPCPLDSPAQMPEWWTRHKTQRVPAAILAAASADQEKAPAAVQPAALPAATKESLGAEQLGEHSFLDAIGQDMLGNVAELRVTVAIAKRQLDLALAGRDDALTTMRQRNYERVFELLRKCEKTVLDLQRERSELIEKAAVARDLVFLVQQVVVMRQMMVRRVLEEVPDLLPEQQARVRAAIEKARAREDTLFRSSKYWETPEHVAAQLAA